MIYLFMTEIEVVIEVLLMFCYDCLIDLLLFVGACAVRTAWSQYEILMLEFRCWI